MRFSISAIYRRARSGWAARLVALACLLSSSWVISSCNRSAQAEPQSVQAPVEVVYWTGWSGHELEIQRQLVDRFNKAHPKIHVRIMTVAGSYEKVALSFAAGNPPDVLSSMWLTDLAGFAMRGALTPLDDFLKASGRDIDKEFITPVARGLQYGGHFWGMMVTTNCQFLIANKKKFLEAGLDPSHPPKTMEELDAANARCAKNDAAGNLVQFGWRPGPLQLMGPTFGGSWYDPATQRISANDPHNVEALRYMVSYAKKYDANKLAAFEDMLSGSNLGYVSDIANFAGLFSGHATMLITGEFCQEFIDRYAPKDFEYFIFPVPAPPGGRYGAFEIGGSVFAIPRDAKHPKEAWEFLNYLSSPEAVKEFCMAIRNMPPLRSLLEQPEFNKTPMQVFAAKLLLGDSGVPPPSMPVWTYYMSQIARAQQEAILGGKDPKQMLDKIQADVEAKFAKAKKYAVY